MPTAKRAIRMSGTGGRPQRTPTVREELLQLAELQRAAAHRLLTLALQLPRGRQTRAQR